MPAPNIPVSSPVFDILVDDKSWIQASDPNIVALELSALSTMLGVLGDVQGKSNDFLDGLANMLPTTMTCVYKNTTTITVKAGRIWCQNATATIRLLRRNSSDTDITSANLDAGGPGFANSTAYYIWAIADAVAETVTFKISTSASAPTGSTVFSLVGGFQTDASGIIFGVYWTGQPAMQKVQSGVVSAGSSLTISDLCPGAKYKLVLDIVGSNDAQKPVLRCNGDSGGNYDWAGGYSATGGRSYGGAAGATGIQLLQGSGIYSPRKLFIQIEISPDSSTINETHVIARAMGDYSGAIWSSHTAGKYRGAAGLASLTFLVDANTFSGNWALYQIS
jgi:FlaG/FlaF family flagellin (archaellin)